jgi:hypothetical protein
MSHPWEDPGKKLSTGRFEEEILEEKKDRTLHQSHSQDTDSQNKHHVTKFRWMI